MSRWRPARVLAAVWLALAAGQTLRLAATGSLMSGDGVYHFAHLHSLVVDRDLDARNEIRHFQQVARSPYTGRPKIGAYPTRHPRTGEPINKYPIGVALLALPAYAIAHGTAQLAAAAGVDADVSGYGALHQWAAGLLIAFWAALGLWCAWKVATSTGIVPDDDGWWAVLCAAGATPWLFYATLEPFFSHALSASAASAMLWLWLRARDGDRVRDWLLVGLAGGVAGLIRYQDLSLLAVPSLDLALRLRGSPTGAVRAGMALTAGASLGIAPQLAVNAIVLGHPFVTGYAREGFLYWRSPWLLYTLAASDVGFLRWAPIAGPAIVGLAIGSRWGWPHARWGLLLLALQVYLVSAWYFYSQGHAFGNRMLVNCTPVIAVGLAALLVLLRPRPRLRQAALVAGLVLVAANALLMGLWAAGRIGPLALSTRSL